MNSFREKEYNTLNQYSNSNKCDYFVKVLTSWVFQLRFMKYTAVGSLLLKLNISFFFLLNRYSKNNNGNSFVVIKTIFKQ